MGNTNSAITGVNSWVPEYKLTNHELSKMVDTNDEWITSRTGIKERRILKGNGLASSDLGSKAVNGLLSKKKISPTEIDLIICATATPDMLFPSTACIIADKIGAKNAFAFDVMAACSGFLYSLDVASKYIESGLYKKIIVVGADKMSSIVDYEDRKTCVIFGDGAGAVLLEPSKNEYCIKDSILKSDGSVRNYLKMVAGGSFKPSSLQTVNSKEHFIYQDGKTVFKFAVSCMADISVEIMKRNNLSPDDVAWLVPHQANKRIIDATANRMGLGTDKVMINIQKYGNTTAGSIPIALTEAWQEGKIKSGDLIVLAAFGSGFTWGSTIIRW
jgi:3-oxoacyl-[acyl-carrier-protein] synthase-3